MPAPCPRLARSHTYADALGGMLTPSSPHSRSRVLDVYIRLLVGALAVAAWTSCETDQELTSWLISGETDQAERDSRSIFIGNVDFATSVEEVRASRCVCASVFLLTCIEFHANLTCATLFLAVCMPGTGRWHAGPGALC